MKKMFLLPAAVVFVSVSALSQETKEANNEMRNSQVSTSAIIPDAIASSKEELKTNADFDKKLIEELKLTDEQTVKMIKLNKDLGNRIDALMQKNSLSPDAIKEKKMDLTKQKEVLFMELLTPEQLILYKTLLEIKNKEKQAAVIVEVLN